MHERIAGRRLRVGVYDSRAERIVAKGIFPPGAELVVGQAEGANLVVASWEGPNLTILSNGHLLQLARGCA